MEMIKIKNPKYIIFLETGENKAAELLLTDDQEELLFLLITGVCNNQLSTGPEMHIERRKGSRVDVDRKR